MSYSYAGSVLGSQKYEKQTINIYEPARAKWVVKQVNFQSSRLRSKACLGRGALWYPTLNYKLLENRNVERSVGGIFHPMPRTFGHSFQ